MNKYEALLQKAQDDGVDVITAPLRGNDGLYCDGCVLVGSHLKTTAEKACILAEQLGHHYTASGNITSNSIVSRKQERLGRKTAYEMLLLLDDLAAALKVCRSKYEVAEHLQITEEFLDNAVEYYFQRYGCWIQTQHGMLYFKPLGLMMNL